MSRNKLRDSGGFLLFDVLYVDDTQTSNRKVPVAEVKEWDFDGSVRAAIEAQDRDIAARSGEARGAIKSVTPSSSRAAERREARNRAVPRGKRSAATRARSRNA